jgi:glutaredoxin
MSPIALILYGRPGCHLCDDMKEIVAPVVRELGCTLEQIDISGNPELEARYGTEIPVLLVNGRKAFKHRVIEPALRRRLAREARSCIRPRGVIGGYADDRR